MLHPIAHASDHEHSYLFLPLAEQQVVKLKDSLSPQHALALSRSALIGLCGVHSRGIIHRDVKPVSCNLI